MTTDLLVGIFAVIAVLALAGWMLTLAVVTKSVLPMANALKTLQAIVDREDTKVASLAERVLQKQNRGKPPEQSQQRPDSHPMEGLFRGAGPPAPVMEQPDSDDGLEIREA